MEHPVIGTSSRKDILSYEQGVRGGWFALLSDDVERLTGRKPRDLRSLFAEHRDEIKALAGLSADVA